MPSGRTASYVDNRCFAGSDPSESIVPLPASHAPTGGVVVPNARGRALAAYLLARRQVPIEGYGGAH